MQEGGSGMRIWRSVLVLVLCVAPAAHAQGRDAMCPRQAPRPLPQAADCSVTCTGEDRWLVKTLLDRDAHRVDFVPRRSTIAALRQLRRPQRRAPDARNSVHERRVYCVEALIVEVRPQDDGDLHVLLRDPDDKSEMIVEVPDSRCQNVCRSPWVDVFSTARKQLEDRLRTWNTDTLRVVVTGVGFFDRNHGQLGAAPNWFELHPVLSVRFPAATSRGR